MRRSLALKLLAGLGVFLPLALLTSEEGRDLLPETFAAEALIGGFVYLAKRRERPRRRSMQDAAERLGLRFAQDDPFGLLDLPFSLFRFTSASFGEVTNVLAGGWRDLQVRVFDYAYSRTEHHVVRLSCAMVAIPGGWPSLTIRPTTTLSSAVGELTGTEIGFESEAFGRAFDVRSEDRRFASALIDARMIEWLLELAPRAGFEIRGPWILAYRAQVQPSELEEVLSVLDGFIDRIPRAARSLYPEALPPRPDRSRGSPSS